MSILEDRLLKKAKEMQNILLAEGHDGEYFNLTISRNGVISFNNNFWEVDEKIDYTDIDALLKIKE